MKKDKNKIFKVMIDREENYNYVVRYFSSFSDATYYCCNVKYFREAEIKLVESNKTIVCANFSDWRNGYYNWSNGYSTDSFK